MDLIGSAAIYTTGATQSGVSVEINVSYLDAAFLDVNLHFFLDQSNLVEKKKGKERKETIFIL